MFGLGLFVDGMYRLGLFLRGLVFPSPIRVQDRSRPAWRVTEVSRPVYHVTDRSRPVWRVEG